MLLFEIGNINSMIRTENERELKAVHELLSVKAEGAHFMTSVRRGHWDGCYHFLSLATRCFPTGLLPKIIHFCKKTNIVYKIHDLRKKPQNIASPDSLSKETFVTQDIEDREYQIESAKRAIKYGRGILHLATNAGKTVIACAIIKHLNVRTLYLVHTKELLYQTKDNIEKFVGTTCGIIGAGETDPQKITVAMVQSLKNRIKDRVFVEKYLKNIELIVGDEIHHAQSRTWFNIFMKCPAYFRFGLSATPFSKDRANNYRLTGVTGRVLVEIRNAFLIEEGYSAVPHVTMFDYLHLLPENPVKLPYPRAYVQFITECAIRNQMIATQVQTLKGTTLIIVTRISHGKTLHDLIPGSVLVTGKSPDHFRKAIASAIRSEKELIVIATTIYDEGVDFPAIHNLVLASGGGASGERQILQRIGRGLRKKTHGENVLKVYDFYDHTNTYLEKHSKNRIKYYLEEKFKFIRMRFER